MAFSDMILMHVLIYSTTPQFTQTPLCLSGATDNTYDGTYNYFTTKLTPWSGVWYNDGNRQYLYAFDFGNNTVEWRVGSSYSNSSAHLACANPNS